MCKLNPAHPGLLWQGLDALSFVGRATLEWGRASVDAASQALTKLDEAGDTWLQGWDSPSGRIPARHGATLQPSPPQAEAEQSKDQGWSPFDFHDDSASESAASPAPRDSEAAGLAASSSRSPGELPCDGWRLTGPIC